MVLASGVAVVVLSVGIYVLGTGGTGVLGRLLQLSANESTFVGRLLYWRDALPLVVSHPLGMGYLGYYYMQQSIQTGLYSVRYVHNDLLQILLDTGWIPFLLFVIAIGKSLFYKERTASEKIILIALVLHSCFDFDLQFVAMFCLMLLFMEHGNGTEYVLKRIPIEFQIGSVLALVISIYGGLVAGLVQAGQAELVHKMYPWHTQNEIQRLTETEDLEEMNEIADRILERNEYVLVAYSAKARYAYANGEFGKLMEIKHTIFELAPFQYEEYEEYCSMLIYGINLYQQAGDAESVAVCREELLAVRETVEDLDSRLSSLGKKIKDQPQTELPEEIIEYIEEGGE